MDMDSIFHAYLKKVGSHETIDLWIGKSPVEKYQIQEKSDFVCWLPVGGSFRDVSNMPAPLHVYEFEVRVGLQINSEGNLEEFIYEGDRPEVDSGEDLDRYYPIISREDYILHPARYFNTDAMDECFVRWVTDTTNIRDIVLESRARRYHDKLNSIKVGSFINSSKSSLGILEVKEVEELRNGSIQIKALKVFNSNYSEYTGRKSIVKLSIADCDLLDREELQNIENAMKKRMEVVANLLKGVQ